MTLGTDDVHVHCRTVGVMDDGEYHRAWALLSPEERARADRFVFAADRERYVIAHALVRRTLSRYGTVPPEAWQFVAGVFGKPAIAASCAAPDLTFNLSHTDGLIACAVARRAIGVDVETVDRRVEGLAIASRFFSPLELEWLRAQAPDEQPSRFTELWTLKEAYVKGIGTGLSCPLNSFGFTFEPDGGIRFHAPTNETGTWYFTLHTPTSRHRLAVAVHVGDSAVRPTISIGHDRERLTDG